MKQRYKTTLADYLNDPAAFPEVTQAGQRVRGQRIDLDRPLTRMARGGVLTGLALSGQLPEMHRSGVMGPLARTSGLHGYVRGDYLPPQPVPEWAHGMTPQNVTQEPGWGVEQVAQQAVGPGGIFGGMSRRAPPALRTSVTGAQVVDPFAVLTEAPPIAPPPLMQSPARNVPADAPTRPIPRPGWAGTAATEGDDWAWARALLASRSRPSRR